MDTLINIGLYVLGIATGVGLLRYGITLGARIQNDEILEKDIPIMQTHTGDEDETQPDDE